MKYEFRQSRIGIGAFATEEISLGETIKFFSGEVLNTKDVLKRVGGGTLRRDDPLQIDDDLYIVVDDTSLYFNHSCDPSAAVRGYNELFAYRAIGVGQEITFDYSTVVGTAVLNTCWSMTCECGSTKCRKAIRSAFYLPAADLKAYAYNGALPDFIVRQCVNSLLARPNGDAGFHRLSPPE
jgi:uncharacterized protein